MFDGIENMAIDTSEVVLSTRELAEVEPRSELMRMPYSFAERASTRITTELHSRPP